MREVEKVEMWESPPGRSLRQAVLTSALRLAPSLSSFSERGRASPPHVCIFKFPPLCRVPWLCIRPLAPANSLFYSPVGGPVTAIQSRPGILEPQGPRTCHNKCQAEIFSLRHCWTVCLPLTLCHLTVKHSHKNAHCSGQKTPLYFILTCTPLYLLIFNVED